MSHDYFEMININFWGRGEKSEIHKTCTYTVVLHMSFLFSADQFSSFLAITTIAIILQ